MSVLSDKRIREIAYQRHDGTKTDIVDMSVAIKQASDETIDAVEEKAKQETMRVLLNENKTESDIYACEFLVNFIKKLREDGCKCSTQSASDLLTRNGITKTLWEWAEKDYREACLLKKRYLDAEKQLREDK